MHDVGLSCGLLSLPPSRSRFRKTGLPNRAPPLRAIEIANDADLRTRAPVEAASVKVASRLRESAIQHRLIAPAE